MSDPQLYGGSSMSYLLTLHTDLAAFSEMGQEAGPGLRRLEVRRRYSQFEKLYKRLLEVPGCPSLPALPGKKLFGSNSAATTEERRAFFEALMRVVGQSAALRESQFLLAFLNDVAVPKYEELKPELHEKCKEVFGVPEDDWKLKSEKRTGKVWFRKLDGTSEGSDLWMVRSEVVVPVNSDDFAKVYYDLDMWKQWTGDFSFRQLDMLEDGSQCMHVTYKTPVIDDRDTVYYSCKWAGMPLDESAKGCTYTSATSVLHPLAPKVKGVVRAHVFLSVTTVEPAGPDGSSTRFRTYTHADPKGNVPSAVVNQMAGQGISELLAVADFMVRDKNVAMRRLLGRAAAIAETDSAPIRLSIAFARCLVQVHRTQVSSAKVE